MIQAQGLKKLYGPAEAVSDVSFSIEEGQVVGFLGPNGAGKTTTMRMLTTFIAPSSGTAQVAGFDICSQGADVRRSIGYLPETPPLYPELKVSEYLCFVAKLHGMSSRSIKPAISEVLERCLITDVSSKLCGALSKGYRQRVGLAGALIHDPKVIILDEPTSGLDPAQIIEIRKLIKSLADKHTVVLSTHILNEVSETCSHAIIISNGKLAAQGSISELTEDRSLEERFLEAVAA
jgi:ABC-2 type transport system ATP-binding protein